MLDFGILVALPQTLPLVLGIFIRRTPAWSGWSTVLICFATGCMTRYFLTVDWAVRTFGMRASTNEWERQNWDQAIAVFASVGLGVAWFCFSRLFYDRTPSSYRQSIEEFSRNIERAVDYDLEETTPASDDRQSRLIGWLCLPYGAVVCLMALIPNPASGRLAFVFCGVVLGLIGTALIIQSRTPSAAPPRA
jgi:solute:Na+ symporter, SSS family